MKTQILKATLLVFIIFFSCHQVSQQHPILEQAEKVMSEHPDSALFLLEQVAAPEKMPERDYRTYFGFLDQCRNTILRKEKRYKPTVRSLLLSRQDSFRTERFGRSLNCLLKGKGIGTRNI
mgnify:CR=1 FL=1